MRTVLEKEGGKIMSKKGISWDDFPESFRIVLRAKCKNCEYFDGVDYCIAFNRFVDPEKEACNVFEPKNQKREV